MEQKNQRGDGRAQGGESRQGEGLAFSMFASHCFGFGVSLHERGQPGSSACLHLLVKVDHQRIGIGDDIGPWMVEVKVGGATSNKGFHVEVTLATLGNERRIMLDLCSLSSGVAKKRR